MITPEIIGITYIIGAVIFSILGAIIGGYLGTDSGDGFLAIVMGAIWPFTLGILLPLILAFELGRYLKTYKSKSAQIKNLTEEIEKLNSTHKQLYTEKKETQDRLEDTQANLKACQEHCKQIITKASKKKLTAKEVKALSKYCYQKPFDLFQSPGYICYSNDTAVAIRLTED